MPKVQADTAEGGRSRRGRRVSSTLAEINVVPLVDVMLVLLIIFMVTAPMMQRGIDVKLPTSRRASPISSSEPLFVTVPLTYRKDQRVMLGDESISVDVLNERIRQALLTRSEKQVFLRSDGGIQVQELMNVVDQLKEGGAENVGIVAADAILPRR
jgi:biopolymer transport protein ExbD